MTFPISSLSLTQEDDSLGQVNSAASIETNRLRVVPCSKLRSDPVRLFEVLSSVGEVQQIDFSHSQSDQSVLVVYFDLRAARNAMNELKGDFKSVDPDSTFDSLAARSVRIRRESNLSLDDTMSALSVYGEIERISFSGADQIVVEFFDTRGPIAVMSALSTGGSSANSRQVGGEARRANYSNPPVCLSTLPISHNSSANVGSNTSVVSGRCDSSEFDINVEEILCEKDQRTTLMVRNIPNKYSQKILLRLVDLRFKDKYDFFYLPIDYKHRCNVGYAFINFYQEFRKEAIVEFFQLFNDKRWDKFNSEKVCKISYARLQGQDALLEHFKSSSVMQQHKQLRPFFVKPGTESSASLLIAGCENNQGSVIESVWSETSGGTTNNGGTVTPVIPPMGSVNLGTVEGSLYASFHRNGTV